MARPMARNAGRAAQAFTAALPLVRACGDEREWRHDGLALACSSAVRLRQQLLGWTIRTARSSSACSCPSCSASSAAIGRPSDWLAGPRRPISAMTEPTSPSPPPPRASPRSPSGRASRRSCGCRSTAAAAPASSTASASPTRSRRDDLAAVAGRRHPGRRSDDSLDLVRGATVDFVESLGGAAFQVTNPNAASGCGCGTSFSI